MEILKLVIIHKNHDTLRYVMFLIQNLDTLQKARQFVLHFTYKMPEHLRSEIS